MLTNLSIIMENIRTVCPGENAQLIGMEFLNLNWIKLECWLPLLSSDRDYNKKKCPTNGYRPAGHGYGPVCKALPCDFKTNYGFTKCNKRIYLNKEYTRSGRECGHVWEVNFQLVAVSLSPFNISFLPLYSNGYCDKSPRPGYGGRHAPGNVAYVPNQGGCRCQTIWCMVKTSAVLKDNNPKYGGYKKDTVTISVSSLK